MSAFGSRSRNRLITVRPPRPESKSPIIEPALLPRLIRGRILPIVFGDSGGDQLPDLLPPRRRREERVVAWVRDEGRFDQHGRHQRVQRYVEMTFDDPVVLGSVRGQLTFYQPGECDVTGLRDVDRRSVRS